MATLAEVNVRIGADIASFQRGLRQAEKDMQKLSGQFTSLGTQLSVGVTAPLVGAAAAAGAFAAGFESSTVKLVNLVGIQGEELEELKRNFTELGPVVGKTQQELADAALFITGAGLRGAAALEALEVSAKASAVGLGDQNAIAKVAGAAVAAYGEANISASEAVDKLLAIVKEGNAEASELAPALGAVLPVASQLGVSFDEVGANIAVFTRLGVGASTAVDGLRSLLGNLLKPSEQAAKEFAKLGISADQVRQSIKDRGLAQTLQDLINAFGQDTEGLARVFGDVQGLTNVLATAGAQGDAYVQTLENIQNSAGGLEEAFARTSETADFKLKQALASLNVAAVNFGAAIIPVAVELLDLLTPLVQGFANLDEGTQSTIITMAALAAAIGPVTTAVGGVLDGFSLLREGYKSAGKAVEFVTDAYFANLTVMNSLGSSLPGVRAGVAALTAGFKALSPALQLGVIGAAVTAITALAFAVSSLNSELNVNQEATRAVRDITQQTEESIVGERLEAERLVGVLRSNTTSYNEKREALEKLQQISPEYFGNLDLEKAKTDALTTSMDGYLASLRRAVAEKLYKGKIEELEIKRLQLLTELENLRANPILTQELGRLTDVQIRLRERIDEQIESREKEVAGIEALQKKYNDLAAAAVKSGQTIQDAFGDGPDLDNEALFGGAAQTGNLRRNAIANLGGGAGGQRTKPRAAIAIPALLPAADLQGIQQINEVLPQVESNILSTRDAMSTLGSAFEVIDNKAIVFGESFDATAEKIKLVQQVMNELLESGANPLGNSISFLNQMLTEMAQGVESVDTNMQALSESMTTAVESGIEDFFINGADALGQLISGTLSGKQAMAAAIEPLLGLMQQVGKIAIQQGITMKAINSSLISGNPVLAIAAGAALIALAAVVRARIRAAAQPRAFAEGGIVTGPTVGLVGEAGPEVIFPLRDLKRFLGDSGSQVSIVGEIYGDTIRLSNDRSGIRQARRLGFNP